MLEDVVRQIDQMIALCPCGAPPRDDSAYCSDDCVPNYRGADTTSDVDGTAMRWRPDLPTADDSDPWADAWDAVNRDAEARMDRMLLGEGSPTRFTLGRDAQITYATARSRTGPLEVIPLAEPVHVRAGETYLLRLDSRGARLIPTHNTPRTPRETRR